MSEILSPKLMQTLRRVFCLDWGSVHGAPHWARVRLNGLQLCEATGANPRVVEAFAFLHDSQRLHDGFDRGHGARAAAFARQLAAARMLSLEPAELDLLAAACEGHSDGRMEADITVQVCWDADRLDLGRVGVRPDPARLCTDAARAPGVIEQAYARSRRVQLVSMS